MREGQDAARDFLADTDEFQEVLADWLTRDGQEATRPVPPVMPRLLYLYLSCKQHHCLLVAGGLLDQPYVLWTAIQAAGRAYEDAVTQRQRAADAMNTLHTQPRQDQFLN